MPDELHLVYSFSSTDFMCKEGCKPIIEKAMLGACEHLNLNVKSICATLETHTCHLHLQGDKIEIACTDKLKDNIAKALVKIEKPGTLQSMGDCEHLYCTISSLGENVLCLKTPEEIFNRLKTEWNQQNCGIEVLSFTAPSGPDQKIYELQYRNPSNHPTSLIWNQLRAALETINILLEPASKAKKPSYFSTTFWHAVLAGLSAIALYCAPGLIGTSVLAQLSLAGFSVVLAFISGRSIFAAASTCMKHLSPWLLMLAVSTICLIGFSPPVWLSTLAFAALMISPLAMIVTAQRLGADMYTAQALSITLVLSSAVLGLAFPSAGFMIHLHHPLMIIAILSANQWFKECIVSRVSNDQPITSMKLNPIEQGFWRKPLYVTRVGTFTPSHSAHISLADLSNFQTSSPNTENHDELIAANSLKEYDVFTLQPGQSTPVACVPFQNVEVAAAAITGEEDQDTWEQLNFDSDQNKKAPHIPSGVPVRAHTPNTDPELKFVCMTAPQDTSDSARAFIPPPIMTRAIQLLQSHLISILITAAAAAGFYAAWMGLPIISTISAMLMVACPCLFCIANPLIAAFAQSALHKHHIKDPVRPKTSTLQRLHHFFAITQEQDAQAMVDKTGTLTEPRYLAAKKESPQLRPGAKKMLEFLGKKGLKPHIVSGDPDSEGQSKLYEQLDLTLKKIPYATETDKTDWISTHLTAGSFIVIGDGPNDQKIHLYAEQGALKKPVSVIIIGNRTPHADFIVMDTDPLRQIQPLADIAQWAVRTEQCAQALATGLTLTFMTLTFLGYISHVMACYLLCGATASIFTTVLLASFKLPKGPTDCSSLEVSPFKGPLSSNDLDVPPTSMSPLPLNVMPLSHGSTPLPASK
jgi:hypothetical protein